jgi:hypothetical protein
MFVSRLKIMTEVIGPRKSNPPMTHMDFPTF